jgi:hypothetical protein
VSFCRIDALAGEDDTDDNFCPIEQFEAGQRGLFSGEVRSSDPTRRNSVECFDVTVSETEGGAV